MRRFLMQLFLVAVVLPHELAHAAPARLAGLQTDVTLLPEWAGPEQPLGQFDANIDAGTPLWLIRLIALGPVVCYVGGAAVFGAVLDSDSLLAAALVPPLSYWAVPSNGDIAVAVNARSARENGAFRAPRLGWGGPFSAMLVPLTTAVVVVLLLG